MKHIGIIEITKEEKELYLKLLEEIDFDDTSEQMKQKINELSAAKDEEISIGSCEFSNDYFLSCMLCSGSSNYYENFVLFDNDGNEVWCNYLDDFMLEDFEIELEENEIYEIKFKII